MDETRLVRKHLIAWAKQLDEPPPASLLPFVDRVLQRAEELVQEQHLDTKEKKNITQEAMRKLTREVDSLETKVATYRRTMPQDIKLFFKRNVADIVEIRSTHVPSQTATAVVAELTAAEESEICETSKRVDTLFAAIQEQMPNTLDRAESNLTALKNADLIRTDEQEERRPPLSPSMESAKLLSQAIATNTRKKAKRDVV